MLGGLVDDDSLLADLLSLWGCLALIGSVLFGIATILDYRAVAAAKSHDE